MNFKPLIDAYRKFGKQNGHDEKYLKVAAHSWGYIAEDSEKAKKQYFHPTKSLVDQISRERAHWSEMTWEQYEYSIGPNGAMFVGNPEEVAKKIIKIIEELGLDRFMLHLPIGSIPHEDVLKSIELYGTEVAPAVKEYFRNKGK